MLAFYQVMLGSLSRTLLDIDSVETIIPPKLNGILKDTIQVARGYLAHIGVREAGESYQLQQLTRYIINPVSMHN